MNQPVSPEFPGTKLPTKECTWRDPCVYLIHFFNSDYVISDLLNKYFEFQSLDIWKKYYLTEPKQYMHTLLEKDSSENERKEIYRPHLPENQVA